VERAALGRELSAERAVRCVEHGCKVESTPARWSARPVCRAAANASAVLVYDRAGR
jgi:hypothetical protein